MGLPIIQVTCNWNQIGGCKLAETVRCDVNQEGVFQKPPLAEIIGNENAILLKQHDIKEPCEFHIKWQPTPYKIKYVSIASTVQRLMLYLGPQKKYINIYVAEELEDFAEDEGEGVFTYRHDIKIKKSNTSELVLKMLPSSDEICIFGVVLQIGLNTKGIDLTSEPNEDVTVETTCNWSKYPQGILYALKYLTAKETDALSQVKSPQEKLCSNLPMKLGIEPAQSTFDIDLENEIPVQATCNWKQTGGCKLSQRVSAVFHHGLHFPLECDIIPDEMAVLSFLDDNKKEPCEIQLKLQSSVHKIIFISIVSTVSKIEVFLGPSNECTDVIRSYAFFKGRQCLYRHDITVEKSVIAEVMLKLMPSTLEIYIYRILCEVKTKSLQEKLCSNLPMKLGIEQAQSTFDIDLANENHEDVTVQATCNWKRTFGCELSQHVRCEVTHEYVFIPPALDTIVKSENAIFLQRDDNSKEPCEVHFKLQTSYYKIESISIVSSVAVIEVFLGPLNEYTDTFHSSALKYSCEDKVCTYRHDIELQKSGIIEVMLKLISTSPEICIFGTLLQIAPNPNGITTDSNIDFDKLLSSQPANCPRKEACMLFLDKIAKKQDLANKNQLSASEANAVASPALDGALKTYLDNRFEQLELKINERLDKAIAEQNAKLDKILDMLVQKTIV